MGCMTSRGTAPSFNTLLAVRKSILQPYPYWAAPLIHLCTSGTVFELKRQLRPFPESVTSSCCNISVTESCSCRNARRWSNDARCLQAWKSLKVLDSHYYHWISREDLTLILWGESYFFLGIFSMYSGSQKRGENQLQHCSKTSLLLL